jgi:hypothetical protein
MALSKPRKDEAVRRLSMRQKTFIREYINNGGNATKAALASYDCRSPAVAAEIGSQNLKKVEIQAEIHKLCDEADLTVKDAVWAIKGGITAKDESGHPAWNTRLRAAEMTLKLHAGSYTGKEEDSMSAKTVHQHVHLELQAVSGEVQRWLANWFREFRSRPTREQFIETWKRDPADAECRLLAPSSEAAKH